MAAKRVPGLPDEWQQYICCLLLHLGLPFLPLLLEWLYPGGAEEKSPYLFIALGLTEALETMALTMHRGERQFILTALKQPSPKGRERYIEKLLNAA